MTLACVLNRHYYILYYLLKLKYFVVHLSGNADLIKNWVLNGKRPDLSVIQFEVSEEAIQLMTACWQETKTNRPSFLGNIFLFGF